MPHTFTGYLPTTPAPIQNAADDQTEDQQHGAPGGHAAVFHHQHVFQHTPRTDKNGGETQCLHQYGFKPLRNPVFQQQTQQTAHNDGRGIHNGTQSEHRKPPTEDDFLPL